MLRAARKTVEKNSPGFGLFRTTGKTSMKGFISKDEESRQPPLSGPFLLPSPLHTTFCQPSPALQLPTSVLCSPPNKWAQSRAPSLRRAPAQHLCWSHPTLPHRWASCSEWPLLQERLMCTSLQPRGSNLGHLAVLWKMHVLPVHRPQESAHGWVPQSNCHPLQGAPGVLTAHVCLLHTCLCMRRSKWVLFAWVYPQYVPGYSSAVSSDLPAQLIVQSLLKQMLSKWPDPSTTSSRMIFSDLFWQYQSREQVSMQLHLHIWGWAGRDQVEIRWMGLWASNLFSELIFSRNKMLQKQRTQNKLSSYRYLTLLCGERIYIY